MHTALRLSPRRLIRVFAIVTFVLATIPSAQADPIVVSGSATLVPGPAAGVRGPVNLTGDNFSASVTTGNGNYGLVACSSFLAGINGPCTGASVGWVSIGSDLFGTFTVNGTTFNSDVINQLSVFFTGPSFLIPAELLGASAVQVTAPFTFSGLAISPALGETIVLQGQGTVYVLLVQRTIGSFSGFFLDHADYIFGATVSGVTVQEVPEPTTLLLLVSGLSGAAIYRRSRNNLKDSGV
jgi:hypothetical protein